MRASFRAWVCAALVGAGCSETATARDAAPDVAPDIVATDAPLVDAPGDASPSDAPRDLTTTDAPVDAIARDAPVDAPRDAGAVDVGVVDTGVVDAGGCGPDATRCEVGGAVVCVDLATDSNHCGACGRACCPGSPCLSGFCRAAGCVAGSTWCNCACVATHSDPMHCGGCSQRCAPGQVCSQGTCVDPCPGGLVRCGARCVDLTNDPMHCGRCGAACAAGQVCGPAGCQTAGCAGSGTGCAAGLCLCAGQCTSLATDTRNCGACGVQCSLGQVCRAGRCELVSDAGVGCATVSEAPAPSGQCDGRGRQACLNWATALLDGGTAFATCVSTPVGCMRADTCASLTDVSTCRCGAGPACGPGQVCAPDATGAPACRCIAR